MNVAFVGLGAMGTPMAANLAKAGHTVTTYRRSGGSTAGDAGLRAAATIADAVRGADVLVTMLPSDAAVLEVADAALAALPAGSVHCSMSTISADAARALAASHERHGVGYVAAPVFGRPDAAAAARLWICVAGAATHVERCEPLFTALGRGVTVAGEEPWRANLIKISGNFLIAAAIESLGEAITLLRGSDVAPELFLETIDNVFASPLYKNYGAQIAARRFEPAGFKLALGLKDVRLVLAQGDSAQTPLPIASLLRDHMLSAIASGDGERDWTAVSEVTGRLANNSHSR